MIRNIIIAVSVIFTLVACGKRNTNKEYINMSENIELYLFVGTYTAKESKGIYVYCFDSRSGDSRYVSMAEVADPSYLAVGNDGKYVYAVTESNEKTDAANAFSFDKTTGNLKFINSQPTNGAAPCYITIDAEGKHVVTANYNGGSITVFEVNEDGSLTPQNELHKFTGKGVDTKRQTQPHLHCVVFSPDGNYLFANDLGTDKIHRFGANKTGEGAYLQSLDPEAIKVEDGQGPRHFEFHPNGKWAYLITEMGGTVIAFNYADGNLTQFQSMIADTLQAKGSGDIHISPDGRFLYASNRLQGDGLAIFTIDQNDGTLTKIGYQETGIHPRNFTITPNGKYLLVACRDSDIIQVFAIDNDTGLLQNTNKDIKLSMPVCLKFISLQ